MEPHLGDSETLTLVKEPGRVVVAPSGPPDHHRRLWRILVALLLLAAGLELSGRLLYAAFELSYGITGSLTLAAILLWGGGTVYVGRRLHSIRWAVGGIAAGAFLLALSQFASLSHHFHVPVLYPLFVRFPMLLVLLEEGGFVGGFILFVIACYRALFSSDSANSRLTDKCQELAEEVAARKTTRRALREKEEQYRVLVETFPHAVLIVQDRKIVFANPAAAAILRMPHPDKLIGLDPFSFVGAQDADRMRGYLAARLRGEPGLPVSYEAWLRRSDGEEYPTLQHVRTTTFHGRPAVQIVGMDLSETRRMEAALQQEQRLLGSIVDTNPESLFVLDAGGQVVTANEACARRLGRRLDEVIGQSFWTLLPEDTGSPRRQLIEGAMLTAQPVRFEDEYNACLYDTYVHPLLDELGRVSGCTVMAVDITPRKQLEAALRSLNTELEERVLRRTRELRQANERLEGEIREREAAQHRLAETLEFNQKLIAESSLGIAAYNQTGVCLLANEAIARMAGLSRDEFIDTNFRASSTWQCGGLFALAERTLRSGTARSGAFQVSSTSGRELWIEAYLVPFHSGGEQHLLLMANDISQRKAMEVALTKSEAKYRELVENANSIILRLDMNGRITFINEFAQQFFDYPEEEILGRPSVGTIVPETDLEGNDLTHMIADLLANPSRYVNNENENMRRDGNRVWIAWTNKPVYGPDGTVKELLCVGNDVTARVQAERIIARQQAQMLHTARLSALGTMASGIAHEINNPLAVISTGIQQLEALFNRGFLDSVSIARIIQTTLRHVNRVHKIIEGLRNLSRDGSNDPFVHVSLGEILNETLELCQERFKMHGIDLEWPSVPPDLKLDCRSSQISQVLLNLLNNAHDAVEPLPDKWVRVEFEEGNGHITLSVTDSGPVPPESVRGKLFIPFYSTKIGSTGTGLGLSISRSIIESHQGEIFLDSGCVHTRFVVRLPRHRVPDGEGVQPFSASAPEQR